MIATQQAPEGWEVVGPGFLLGECDRGYLWLPTWRWKKDAVRGGERMFGRPFNPRNPLHWPRYLNSRRRREMIGLESM